MRKQIQLLYFTFAVLLAGCGANGSILTAPEESHSAQTTPPSLTTASPTSTETAARSQTFTQTPPIPPQATATRTPTPTATARPAVPSDVRLSFQCLEVASTLPSNVSSSGILVLDSRVDVNGRSSFDTFLLDMASGKTTLTTGAGENQSSHQVSPDGKLLAYRSVLFDNAEKIVQEELVIAAADGQRLKVIPWEEGGGSFRGWLADQRLVINLAGLDPEEAAGEKAATLMVLNPFTGERQVLKPDYPEIYDWPPLPSWLGWGGTVIDPTFSRVIYPKYTGKDDDYSYAIWDLQAHSMIASLEAVFTGLVDYFPYPLWSPDGSRFVVEGYLPEQKAFELFLVSRDGQVEQLTNIFPYESARLEAMSWSPNGRYIAAWLNSSFNPYSKPELVIVDTNTGQVTDYCISNASAFKHPLDPLWSPDSTQLIVRDLDGKNRRRVMLIDLIQGFAAQIAEDMEPLGWMQAP